MEAWVALRPMILDEIIRRDGLQDYDGPPTCAHCHDEIGTFRCLDCGCITLYCSPCIVQRHEHLPLHRIEVCSQVPPWPFIDRVEGLARWFLSAHKSSQIGTSFLHRPPTYFLPIRHPLSSDPCNRHKWRTLCECTILCMRRDSRLGRTLPPTFTTGLVPCIVRSTENGLCF